ncbi:alpha/beta hydrolase [Nitratireductor sp. XY-223]|uniref:alpha/beta fold hydrolase n=1 Tax=Nitratireductor sp. XY-223 TaxID=2561926 RepID=UPI0010AA1E08|nr:alpha/beta hydrolase [Nitratireductor sp. XY-223]
MPYAQINGANIHYLDEGAGAETVVFSHGLLMSADMFAAQIEALKGSYRCIAFDHRGQGKSAVTESGYDMETLAEDAAGLIESLGVAPCHFVGLSMGGFVGMRLAARRPELLRSLTLIETSAEPEDKSNVPRYRLLNFIARWFGLRLVVGQVMPIMFGQTFLNDPDRRQDKALWRERLAANDRIGITRAVKGVVDRAGVAEEIGRIDMPVLIIVGEEDVATVPEHSEKMHRAIAGSSLVRIAGAGHSSTIETPQEVNRAIGQFLTGLSATAEAHSGPETAKPA